MLSRPFLEKLLGSSKGKGKSRRRAARCTPALLPAWEGSEAVREAFDSYADIRCRRGQMPRPDLLPVRKLAFLTGLSEQELLLAASARRPACFLSTGWLKGLAGERGRLKASDRSAYLKRARKEDRERFIRKCLSGADSEDFSGTRAQRFMAQELSYRTGSVAALIRNRVSVTPGASPDEIRQSSENYALLSGFADAIGEMLEERKARNFF